MTDRCMVCRKPFKTGDLLQAFLRCPEEPQGSWTDPAVVDSEYQERAAKHKAAGSGDNAKRKHFNCKESIMTERTIIAIDIETDGLKWVGGQILEVCMHRLDADLNIVETFQGVLPFNIEGFSEFIMDMHSKNGLVNEAPTCELADVADWLNQFENIVWLGSSVQFDKSWVEHHIQGLNVNHRVIDVSSLKGLVDLTNRLPKTESDHRAASDIAYSLDVARLYRDVLQAGVL